MTNPISTPAPARTIWGAVHQATTTSANVVTTSAVTVDAALAAVHEGASQLSKAVTHYGEQADMARTVDKVDAKYRIVSEAARKAVEARLANVNPFLPEDTELDAAALYTQLFNQMAAAVGLQT